MGFKAQWFAEAQIAAPFRKALSVAFSNGPYMPMPTPGTPTVATEDISNFVLWNTWDAFPSRYVWHNVSMAPVTGPPAGFDTQGETHLEIMIPKEVHGGNNFRVSANVAGLQQVGVLGTVPTTAWVEVHNQGTSGVTALYPSIDQGNLFVDGTVALGGVGPVWCQAWMDVTWQPDDAVTDCWVKIKLHGTAQTFDGDSEEGAPCYLDFECFVFTEQVSGGSIYPINP